MASVHHSPLLLLLLLVAAGSTSAQPSSNSPTNNMNNNSPFATNFNPSMAIVIVVLISAFFFLGFFSLYIRQCTGDRDDPRYFRGGAGGTNAIAALSRRNRGLDPEVLQTFPTLVYSEVKGLKIGKGTLECAVCLSEFEDDETLRLLPKCSHVFHPDCIDAWLASHVTCPVCRTDLVPDPNAPPIHPPVAQEPVEPLTPQESAAGPSDHVAVDIPPEEEKRADMIDLENFVNLKRAKSKARPVSLFPRSHSTGHSLVQPGENLDRFTLKLPADIKREIVAASKLKRTKSLVVFPTEGSSRRGYRGGGGDGSTGRAGRSIRLGRSDRWGAVLLRTLSAKVPNWGRRGEPDGSVKGGPGKGYV